MSLSPTQLALSLSKFRKLVEDWRSSFDETTIATLPKTQPDRVVLVVFRTRPVLPWEEKMLADQLVSSQEAKEDQEDSEVSMLCPGMTVKKENPGVSFVHVPSMKWNGPTLTHKKFLSDLAFGPDATNDHIYDTTIAASDMISLVLSGGIACVLAYGQTGSGKTYTMTALESLVAKNLFNVAEAAGKEIQNHQVDPTQYADKKGIDSFEITVTFVEIVGKAVYDLGMGETNRHKIALQVSEDKLGKVHLEVKSFPVKSPEELEGVIAQCLSYRHTAPTTRNDASSRSHAILKISVKNLLIPELEDGEFFLVDLAGSERYEDRKAHSKQLMDESKENNKSLLALKECVRARARAGAEDGFVHIPYRSSRLTWVLKSIFDMEETRPSKTLVIANIPPHIQDASHTVNTLSYAEPFRVIPPRKAPAPFDAEDPRTWDHNATVAWLEKAFAEQRKFRREGVWRNQDEAAQAQGKVLTPLAQYPAKDVPCIVDLERLCPPKMGGSFLAKMYGAEWVKSCLASRRSYKEFGEGVTDEVVVEAVNADALNVYLAFGQLLVTARTKTRNAVMQDRKPVEYTEDPSLPEIGLSIIEAMSDEERFAYETEYPEDVRNQRKRELWALGEIGSERQLYHKVQEITVKEFREKRAREKEEMEKKMKEMDMREMVEFVDIDV